EFRPRTFRFRICSAGSVPLPSRSTSVKLKLPSASASSASVADDAATHWYPRRRRNPNSPGRVGASTSTTRALISLIAGRGTRKANAVPGPSRREKALDVTNLAQKTFVGARCNQLHRRRAGWVVRDLL